MKFDKSIYNGKLNLTNDEKHFSVDPIALKVIPSSEIVEISIAESKQKYEKVLV